MSRYADLVIFLAIISKKLQMVCAFQVVLAIPICRTRTDSDYGEGLIFVIGVVVKLHALSSNLSQFEKHQLRMMSFCVMCKDEQPVWTVITRFVSLDAVSWCVCLLTSCIYRGAFVENVTHTL